MTRGIVIKSTGKNYTVKTEGGTLWNCVVRGKLRIEGIRSTNPIAVGDNVIIKINPNSDLAFITSILDRKNYIIRKSINLAKRTHIIAANIDQSFLVITKKNPVTTNIFIDRFLVSAEAYRIPVILVFNKIDLYNETEINSLDETIAIYETIGYQCIKISATENINIDILRDLMKDKINVVSGHSGVGKSSLINVLDSNLSLRVSEISDIHLRGKHTTTHYEMFDLESGGYIIDTPGIKGFGVIDIEKEELFHFFKEIFEVSKHCKYNNCNHTHEPDCAVKIAVENDKISRSRYNSYLNIYFEDDDVKHRAPH